MKVKFKFNKVFLILTALLTLNVLAYFALSVYSRQAREQANTSTHVTETEGYIHSGVKVLNWSYTMIRYFRQRGSDNT